MTRYLPKSVEELFGNTPIVKLRFLPDKNGAAIYAKLDFYNPGRSVKDRIVHNMVIDAEKRGLLKKGGAIIEASSGNTGVSLALIGCLKGYKIHIVMPDSSNERIRKILKRFGAKVEYTPADQGMGRAKERVMELSGNNGHYYYPDQFNNPSNTEIHRNTTAKEILKSMGSKKIDAFVAGVGTGGTITGVGEVLKAKFPKVKIVAVEPQESAVLSGGNPGVHFIDGIGPGFVPPLLNRDIIDQVVTVSSEAAQETTEKIALKEGIVAGISSGAVLFAARKIASKMSKNSNVVAFFADAAGVA